MATNKDLKNEIYELCKKLGKSPIDTKGMNNEMLTALVDDLKSGDVDEPKPSTGNKIAEGKAIITPNRGILSDGESVSVDDFKSIDQFNNLKSLGYIVGVS